MDCKLARHATNCARQIDNPARPGGAREVTALKMTDERKMTFPVEATHIMMFRRSIGDYSVPDTGIGDAVAPPTFPRAVAQFDPEYHLRIKPGKPWFGSGKNPSGLDGKPPSSGGLHAEQHFEFMRPVRPGDVLEVTEKMGKSWEKESKRAGKLQFLERIHEYRDQNGELVCISRSVSVKTERPVDQK
jgi:hypothetical protein